jgi:hypothetical protein
LILGHQAHLMFPNGNDEAKRSKIPEECITSGTSEMHRLRRM